ncbi:hypothetical protein ABW19_dt0200179 [Dactylella cylindrospora]|nr:hypothetical protein ABW19_dt0200179 [Dactylella cylindrospora]
MSSFSKFQHKLGKITHPHRQGRDRDRDPDIHSSSSTNPSTSNTGNLNVIPTPTSQSSAAAESHTHHSPEFDQDRDLGSEADSTSLSQALVRPSAATDRLQLRTSPPVITKRVIENFLNRPGGYQSLMAFVQSDPTLDWSDIKTGKIERSRICVSDFRELLGDICDFTVREQVVPNAFSREMAVGKYIPSLFSRMISWFDGLLVAEEASNLRTTSSQLIVKHQLIFNVLRVNVAVYLGVDPQDGVPKAEYLGHLVAEMVSCGLKNDDLGNDTPTEIYGIFTDGVVIEIYEYTPVIQSLKRLIQRKSGVPQGTIVPITLPDRPHTMSGQWKFVRDIRPVLEILYTVLLKAFLSGLKQHSGSSDGPLRRGSFHASSDDSSVLSEEAEGNPLRSYETALIEAQQGHRKAEEERYEAAEHLAVRARRRIKQSTENYRSRIGEPIYALYLFADDDLEASDSLGT